MVVVVDDATEVLDVLDVLDVEVVGGGDVDVVAG